MKYMDLGIELTLKINRTISFVFFDLRAEGNLGARILTPRRDHTFQVSICPWRQLETAAL
jgi:hypothetical protein